MKGGVDGKLMGRGFEVEIMIYLEDKSPADWGFKVTKRKRGGEWEGGQVQVQSESGIADCKCRVWSKDIVLVCMVGRTVKGSVVWSWAIH